MPRFSSRISTSLCFPFLASFASILATSATVEAGIKPHGLFRDHAVLQRGVKLPVWGTSDKPGKVTVSIAGQEASTEPKDGKWRVATGDSVTIQRFLKANTTFARKFPIRQPRIYVKQDGKWVLVNLRGK